MDFRFRKKSEQLSFTQFTTMDSYSLNKKCIHEISCISDKFTMVWNDPKDSKMIDRINPDKGKTINEFK